MAYNSNVTATDVTEIFDTGLSTGALETWIGVAEQRVGDLPDHDDLTTDRKDELVKFLAAALATAQDPRVDKERHEAATVSYGGERMGYMAVAMMLDPTDVIGSDDGPGVSIDVFEVR